MYFVFFTGPQLTINNFELYFLHIHTKILILYILFHKKMFLFDILEALLAYDHN